MSLPPHLTLANTPKSNVLLNHSAPSTRGVLSCLASSLPAGWGASLASFTPAWGNGRALRLWRLRRRHLQSGNGRLLAVVEGNRTAKVDFGMQEQNYSFDVPMPGETFAALSTKVR